MTYYMPENLKEVASFSNSGYSQLPDHMHYKCTGLLHDIADDVTYDGKEVLEVEVYFGINEQETRERRNRDGWSPTDEDVSTGDAGPLLIDIAVYFMLRGERGKTIETNFYTDEPAEHISTATYEEIIRDHAISAMRSTPQVDW